MGHITMRGLPSALCLFAILISYVGGHAEFFMADSSYRKNAEGNMYCHAEIKVGASIMGKALVTSDEFKVELVKKGETVASDGPFCASDELQVYFTGNSTGTEYIFVADGGATFAEGGCGNTRSTLNGNLLTLGNANATIKVAYGACTGEPPFPCQISATTPRPLVVRPHIFLSGAALACPPLCAAVD